MYFNLPCVNFIRCPKAFRRMLTSDDRPTRTEIMRMNSSHHGKKIFSGSPVAPMIIVFTSSCVTQKARITFEIIFLLKFGVICLSFSQNRTFYELLHIFIDHT